MGESYVSWYRLHRPCLTHNKNPTKNNGQCSCAIRGHVLGKRTYCATNLSHYVKTISTRQILPSTSKTYNNSREKLRAKSDQPIHDIFIPACNMSTLPAGTSPHNGPNKKRKMKTNTSCNSTQNTSSPTPPWERPVDAANVLINPQIRGKKIFRVHPKKQQQLSTLIFLKYVCKRSTVGTCSYTWPCSTACTIYYHLCTGAVMPAMLAHPSLQPGTGRDKLQVMMRDAKHMV